MAMAAGRIGIETVVWSRGDDYAVAVNIDVAQVAPVQERSTVGFLRALCSHAP